MHKVQGTIENTIKLLLQLQYLVHIATGHSYFQMVDALEKQVLLLHLAINSIGISNSSTPAFVGPEFKYVKRSWILRHTKGAQIVCKSRVYHALYHIMSCKKKRPEECHSIQKTSP